MVKLLDFQEEVLTDTADFNRVAYYFDMGLGKTFIGAEKLIRLDTPFSLVVCQKSKVMDWYKHFFVNYPCRNIVFDLTNKRDYENFLTHFGYDQNTRKIGIINYDLLIRRPELKQLENFTLMLDESQYIANETAKRTKFVLKLRAKNVILLSGTPVGGKYEQLYSQMKLLGVKMTKTDYWEKFIRYVEIRPNNLPMYFPAIKVVTGYKNVDYLKLMLRQHGARFMKSEEVLTLPEQIFETVKVDTTTTYRKFVKNKVVTVGDEEFVGDTTFKQILYERMLCGSHNKEKLNAFKDLIDSTNDRFIVFYNFKSELQTLRELVGERPVSVVCGDEKDLSAYETHDDSITFVQYQSGASGLNLQKAKRMIYFTLPLSSAMFEQSKKRIHRIGQSERCFYYSLVCRNSIEERISDTLEKRRDFTNDLFEKGTIL